MLATKSLFVSLHLYSLLHLPKQHIMTDPIDVTIAQDGGIMKTILEAAPEGGYCTNLKDFFCSYLMHVITYLLYIISL